MVWVGRGLQGHPVPTPLPWRQGKGNPSLGGLEPPTFQLTAERANPLRHRDSQRHLCSASRRHAQLCPFPARHSFITRNRGLADKHQNLQRPPFVLLSLTYAPPLPCRLCQHSCLRPCPLHTILPQDKPAPQINSSRSLAQPLTPQRARRLLAQLLPSPTCASSTAAFRRQQWWLEKGGQPLRMRWRALRASSLLRS